MARTLNLFSCFPVRRNVFLTGLNSEFPSPNNLFNAVVSFLTSRWNLSITSCGPSGVDPVGSGLEMTLSAGCGLAIARQMRVEFPGAVCHPSLLAIAFGVGCEGGTCRAFPRAAAKDRNVTQNEGGNVLRPFGEAIISEESRAARLHVRIPLYLDHPFH